MGSKSFWKSKKFLAACVTVAVLVVNEFFNTSFNAASVVEFVGQLML
jgi:hypothetical protein